MLSPKKVLPLTTVLAVLRLTAPAGAQTSASYAEAPAAEHAAAVEFASVLLEAMMEESGTPGVSIAVGLDGDVVWADGFGYADIENRTAVWEETKFRIGSVSKPLTAAALGLLFERGRLDLDAPVRRYVPAFPEKRWEITTRQLAGHLAGVRHYVGEEFLSAKRYKSVGEGLEIFAEDSLLFEPGTLYSYSSYGWNLISAVIEGAADAEYLTYMRENVFEPLGLEHTVADHTDSIIPQRTRFYVRASDGRILNAPYVDNSYKWAGGGFLSTPSDLVRFAFAHIEPGFLSSETVDTLWTSQRTADGEETGYGIGWSVREDSAGQRQVAHGGGSVGGTTLLILYPERRAGLAIVGNMSNAPVGSPARLILDAFLEPESVASDASGPDISGSYACRSETEGEEEVAASLELGGSPSEYWGRLHRPDAPASRVVHSSTRADGTWLVVVDERGRFLSLRFDEMAPGRLSGTWSSGGPNRTIICEVAASD